MENPLEEKTIQALKWIAAILDKNKIPYRIGGGFAAHVYGSPRRVEDIDIALSGTYFSLLVSEVSEYITAGPKHHVDAKWDCDTLTINYHGQEIDISDIDTLRMSNKEKTKWLQTKDLYRTFDPILTTVEGAEVFLIDPRDLAAYKKHLDGDHQNIDIEAVEKYITEQEL